MLEKSYRGRMRFLGAPEISLESEFWLSQTYAFKTFIRESTNYQIIDNGIYWLCNFDLTQTIASVCILGTPKEIERKVIMIDQNPGDFWKCQIEVNGEKLVTLDDLKLKILPILASIPPEMDPNFHLVMNEEKIELHFFLQKDYIG
jgi:hypothetical protein